MPKIIFTPEEIVEQIDEQKIWDKVLKEADSDDMIEEVQSRGDMPECVETHLEDASTDQLRDALDDANVDIGNEKYALDLIRWGVQDKDWKKIEEAASRLGIFILKMKMCNKPALSPDLLTSAVRNHRSDRV
jgi:hypothetical protein